MEATSLRIIYLISFLDLFAIGLIFPLFSTHLKSLGASHFMIGLATSTYAGIQILSGPIVGGWSDVRDRRVVLSITLAICSVCYILLSLSESIIWIFILRSVLGTVKHTQGICKAMVSDLFSVEKQAEIMGRSAAFGSVGFIAGPLMGGYISEVSNGFAYACNMTAFVFVCNIVLVNYLPPLERAKKDGSSVFNLHQIQTELKNAMDDAKKVDWSKNKEVFLLRFLYGLSITTFFANQSIYLKEYYTLSQRHIGYAISFYSAISTSSVFLMKYIISILYSDRSDSLERMYHFFSLMFVSCILLSLAPNMILFTVMLIPFALSSAILRISSMELMMLECPANQKGTYAGISTSIMSIARFVTPLLSGIMGDVVGSHIFMILPSIPAIFGTCMSYNLYKMKNS